MSSSYKRETQVKLFLKKKIVVTVPQWRTETKNVADLEESKKFYKGQVKELNIHNLNLIYLETATQAYYLEMFNYQKKWKLKRLYKTHGKKIIFSI